MLSLHNCSLISGESHLNPANINFVFKPDRLMENDTDCQCPYCKIGSASCGNVGNKLNPRGGPPIPRGRPKAEENPSTKPEKAQSGDDAKITEKAS